VSYWKKGTQRLITKLPPSYTLEHIADFEVDLTTHPCTMVPAHKNNNKQIDENDLLWEFQAR